MKWTSDFAPNLSLTQLSPKKGSVCVCNECLCRHPCGNLKEIARNFYLGIWKQHACGLRQAGISTGFANYTFNITFLSFSKTLLYYVPLQCHQEGSSAIYWHQIGNAFLLNNIIYYYYLEFALIILKWPILITRF